MRSHHSSSWFEKTSLFRVQTHLLLHPFCCLALSFIWLQPVLLLMEHHGLFWSCDDVASQQSSLPMLCKKHSQLMPLSQTETFAWEIRGCCLGKQEKGRQINLLLHSSLL